LCWLALIKAKEYEPKIKVGAKEKELLSFFLFSAAFAMLLSKYSLRLNHEACATLLALYEMTVNGKTGVQDESELLSHNKRPFYFLPS